MGSQDSTYSVRAVEVKTLPASTRVIFYPFHATSEPREELWRPPRAFINAEIPTRFRGHSAPLDAFLFPDDGHNIQKKDASKGLRGSVGRKLQADGLECDKIKCYAASSTIGAAKKISRSLSNLDAMTLLHNPPDITKGPPTKLRSPGTPCRTRTYASLTAHAV